MASHVYPIPSVERTITRPIAITILRQLLEITGLNPKEFRTKVVGVADSEKVQGSYLNDTENISDLNNTPNDVDKDINRLSTDKKLTLEIQDEIVGNFVTPVRWHDHLPVFDDQDLKVRIKPVYSDIKTTISVVLNVRDKVEANNWLQEVRRRIYQTAMATTHNADYYYIIPQTVSRGLYEIYKLKENIAPDGEEFGEWLNRCFDNRFDILTNLSGTNHMLVIKEKQVNILGYFDFEFEPEKPEKEDDKAGGWRIQFDYVIRYQRPDNVVFEYPLAVHQQLLPESMLQLTRPDHWTSYNVFRGHTAAAYHRIAVLGNKHGMKGAEGIAEPWFDDWVPDKAPVRHIQLTRVLLSIAEDEPNWLIDIDDFAETFEFKPEIKRWFGLTTNKIFKERDNPFYFSLHESTRRLPDSQCHMTEELKIMYHEDLNLKQMYHIVVYVLTDISLLSADGWRDLLKNCDVFHEWLAAIYPNTGTEKIRCNIDNSVNTDDFKDWWNENAPGTDDISGPLPNGPGLPWSDCVGTFCETKPGWWPETPDKPGTGSEPAKTTDYKSVGWFGIIAKRRNDDA